MEFSIFSFANLFFLILRGGAGGEGEGGVVDKHGIYDTYKDSVYGVTNSWDIHTYWTTSGDAVSAVCYTIYYEEQHISRLCQEGYKDSVYGVTNSWDIYWTIGEMLSQLFVTLYNIKNRDMNFEFFKNI